MIAVLRRRPWLALIAAMIVQTVAFFVAQRDIAAADPLWYAVNAFRWATSPGDLFADNHPFVMRVGVTGPVALAYRTAGVSLWTTDLLCLVACLMILGVVYAAMETPRAKVLAMVIATAAAPLLARDAFMLNPDLPSAAWMAVGVLCLSRRERGPAWIALAVGAWFLAFLTKETAIWCVPVFAIAWVSDRFSRRYVPAIVTGLVLGAGYLIVCRLVWGDALARFHGIQHLDHTWSLHGRGAHAWLARLTWQPIALLWQLLGFLIVPAVLSLRFASVRMRTWLVATWVFVLLYWFGSSTLSQYSPLPLMFRMAYPLVPGLLIVSAATLDSLLDRTRVATIAFIGVLVVVPHALRLVKLRGSRDEQAAFEKVLATARTANRLTAVCGDPRCPGVADFYFGFAKPSNVSVVDETTFAPAPGDRVLVVVHKERAAEYKTTIGRRAQELGLPRVYESTHVSVYDAGDGAALAQALRR